MISAIFMFYCSYPLIMRMIFELIYCILMKEDLNSKVTKEEKIFEGKYLGMKYVEFTIGDKSFP